MSSPRLHTSVCGLDVNIVRANVRWTKGDDTKRCLIALRRGDAVHVRNARRDPDGMVAENMIGMYCAARGQSRVPHRRAGVRVSRLEEAGFRIHRLPFLIDRELPNAVVDTTEDDFNRWWRRRYYPGCDIYGFMKAQRRLTQREVLIRSFYANNGTRWTPVRIRKLARQYGTDIESLCAAVRLPIHIFAWYEDVYHDNPASIPVPVTNLLGPAFLLFDLMQGMKQGATGSIFFPFADLRASPAAPATKQEAA